MGEPSVDPPGVVVEFGPSGPGLRRFFETRKIKKVTKSPAFQQYAGPERRRRFAYVTRNTEYHLADGVCVAVRDRTSGKWLLEHPTLRKRLSGFLRLRRGASPEASLAPPRVGTSLFFGAEGAEVVTSNLLAVERPEKTTIVSYPV